jgi:hypothetical protein
LVDEGALKRDNLNIVDRLAPLRPVERKTADFPFYSQLTRNPCSPPSI